LWHPGRDQERVAGVQGQRAPSVDHRLDRAGGDVTDLLADWGKADEDSGERR
jgi:hypothetical protein